MKEQDFINIIKTKTENELIGDDCAYLKDLGIVITQDSLVEGVHFRKEWYTPYELGYKSTAVNISDILASGAKPKYITIALSLPKNIDNIFIEQFYEGVKSCLNGAKIAGGDITGSKNDIVISITAVGSTINRNISSRKNAKEGYFIVVKGMHGSSARGLRELLDGKSVSEYIKAHKRPVLEYEFSEFISKNTKNEYAMMDTSDGLADALFKIAQASNIKLCVEYKKIPKLSGITKEEVLFGGEDYKLLAVVPKDIAENSSGIIIGKAEVFDGYYLDIDGEKYSDYNELNMFNHFN